MKRLLQILAFLCLLGLADWGCSALLNKGLDRYFGLDKPADVVMVGHSHLMLALDKEKLERELGMTVAKYCREGVNVSDRRQMLAYYLSLPASKNTRLVIYGVDPFMFTAKGLSANSYKLFYPYMDAPVMAAYIKTQAKDEFDYWIHKLVRSSRYSDALINSAIRGWMNNWANYKRGTVTLEQIKAAAHREIAFEADLVEDFSASIQQLTNAGIRVILLDTPVVDTIRRENPAKCARVSDFLRQMDESEELVEYWDMNPEFSSRYELFYDAIHLNDVGQREVTKLFVDTIRKEMQNHD